MRTTFTAWRTTSPRRAQPSRPAENTSAIINKPQTGRPGGGAAGTEEATGEPSTGQIWMICVLPPRDRRN